MDFFCSSLATVGNGISHMLKDPLTWKILGVVSSTVCLVCYYLSSSFQHLYGENKPLKITVYVVLSLVWIIINCIIVYAERLEDCRPSRHWLIALIVCLVLMATSLYSFYYDKKVPGKPDMLMAISNGAFTFMSLSLSKRIHVQFESGLSNYFLACFATQLLKIKLVLIILAAVFSYIVIFLRNYSDSESGTHVEGSGDDIGSGRDYKVWGTAPSFSVVGSHSRGEITKEASLNLGAFPGKSDAFIEETGGKIRLSEVTVNAGAFAGSGSGDRLRPRSRKHAKKQGLLSDLAEEGQESATSLSPLDHPKGH